MATLSVCVYVARPWPRAVTAPGPTECQGDGNGSFTRGPNPTYGRWRRLPLKKAGGETELSPASIHIFITACDTYQLSGSSRAESNTAEESNAYSYGVVLYCIN